MQKELNLLRRWFQTQSRELPWRVDRSPYSVWVSEIMLQQTQVSVVIPYYLRWMNRFPTLEHLANAHLDDVIKLWEGLGYYSRARNLHQGAKQVVEQFSGVIPQDPKQLIKIKGIGKYTVGAICGFAFQQKIAAVDGNVLRVLARYFQIEEDIKNVKTQEKIYWLASELLPEKEPWVISEALIELGATVCKKTPNCVLCPLKGSCKAFLNNKTNELPLRSKGKGIEQLFRSVVILKCGDNYLVKRCTEGRIMADLHEFPYFEGVHSAEELRTLIKNDLGIAAKWTVDLPVEVHSFTRFKARLSPFIYTVNKRSHCEGGQWMTLEEMHAAAFSSGHRRILQSLTHETT